ncbi:hypothetical protein [Salinimicrobium soli]
MKKKFYFMSVLILVGVFINGCEVEEDPELLNVNQDSLNLATSITSNDDGYVNFMEAFESADLNGYTIVLEDHFFSADGSTTFVYSVEGTGATAQLDSFYLEVPECAGTVPSWSPTQSSKLEDGRIKWNNSISKDGKEVFTITYEGDISLGIIDVTVVRGGIETSTKVLGPCAGVYTISGSIFIDANSDKTKQPSETGIGGYTINLDQGEYHAEVQTSGDGSYSFEVLEGSYTVSVGSDLLNDQNYTATTVVSYDVDVTGDVTGKNFGYQVEATKITGEFNNGTIPLDTEDYKFWIQQIKNAGKNNSGYSKADLNKLLSDVEMYLLDVPFQFGGNKAKTALDILSKPIKSELDLYLQQLLTAELNVKSGRGAYKTVDGKLVLNESFNTALMIYAEARACEALGSCPSEEAAARTQATTKATRSLSTDIVLITSFNNGSGGL